MIKTRLILAASACLGDSLPDTVRHLVLGSLQRVIILSASTEALKLVGRSIDHGLVVLLLVDDIVRDRNLVLVR